MQSVTINQGDLLRELRRLRGDFKASVVGAEIAGYGVEPASLFFRNQSTFRRQVSKDIEHIFWSEADYAPDMLVFDVNREGIYDMLPESLLHPQDAGRRRRDSDQKLGAELRQQEKQARTFFSPIENEFAHRSLRLDIIERELLRNDSPERCRQFFEFFFGNSRILTDQQVVMLTYLLPLCHKIRSDAGLIALVMCKVLGYEVQVTKETTAHVVSVEDEAIEPLGECRLGVSAVLNDRFTSNVVRYAIRISDVPVSAFMDFAEGGRQANVINFMLPYFLPAAADYSVAVSCMAEQRPLQASTPEDVCYLGFNSYI